MPWRWLQRVRSAVNRLDAHALHHRAHGLAANLDAFATQQVAPHPAGGKRIIEMKCIHSAHDMQICLRHRTGLVMEAATVQPRQPAMLRQCQLIGTVDRSFSLSMPDLLGALSKKSFSSVGTPIFACRVFKSIAGDDDAPVRSERNTDGTPSRSCAFQFVIWLG